MALTRVGVGNVEVGHIAEARGIVGLVVVPWRPGMACSPEQSLTVYSSGEEVQAMVLLRISPVGAAAGPMLTGLSTSGQGVVEGGPQVGSWVK